ncbi:MAG: lysophospholipid acyltransferase family protein, partial [Lentisphaeria bacterium]|nr:lysophospholipid acyltransferase family protein [Lentisphaeria bacterium]
RRVTSANLAVAFPEKSDAERRRIARASIMHLILLGFDWLHQLKHPHECTKNLEVSEEYRRDCSALNPNSRCQAALYCTLHLGNWEALSRISYVTGRAGAVVVARFKIDWLNQLSERLRTSGDGTKVIPAEGAARGVLRALLSGLNVGILIDQNVSPRKGGIFQNFFGLPATVSRHPAVIARKLQIPVYVCSCIRHDDGIFRTEYAMLEKNAWEFESDEALTAAIYRAYEELIKRHPEQYLWSYNRWRAIPANASDELAAKYPFYASRKKFDCPPNLLEK